MLGLQLTHNNEIHIGDDIVIRLSFKQPDNIHRARISIEAPRNVGIWREPNQQTEPGPRTDGRT
jgi:sRNA-binding carbon storage regulator CsrA